MKYLQAGGFPFDLPKVDLSLWAFGFSGGPSFQEILQAPDGHASGRHVDGALSGEPRSKLLSES